MTHHSLVMSVLALSLGASGCHSPDARQITMLYPELEPIVQGTNDYSWWAWQASRSHLQGNMFYSPFSQVAAMSMVYAGAEGETEAQIGVALGVPEGGEDSWHQQMGLLLADLTGEHYRPYTLYAANKIWGQAGYPWEEDFLSVVDEQYLAPLEDADFAGDYDTVRQDINDWVAEQTRDRIAELFKQGDISSDTRMVLANAIYFLADWEEQFDEDETQYRDFTLSSGATVNVPMMYMSADLSLGSFDGVQVLEMPYESGEVSMVFIMPSEHDGLDALEDSLNTEQVATWLDGLAETEVSVIIPSFQMECDFPIEDVLLDLGVVDAWNATDADFSGLLDPAWDGLWLGKVVHKAFVRVDEQGTEAAAATGAAMVTESAEVSQEFHADHPFIFLIRDRLTGTVLFQGRMTDPSQAPLVD